ncbi:MAG: hypothetical protein MJ093_07090 [Saccharofermentans sp.]|nr:hypothetical protein [Saccharofermentans sp.]
MNKLDRFRFGGAHRRKMKVIGITTLSVFVIGLGLLAVVGVFGSRSENVRLVLDEQSNGVVMEGVGINLPEIPSSNRLSNYDFEDSLNSQSYTVSGADNSYLYFESDSDISNQPINSGDNVDVYSLDSNGIMNLRFSGTVYAISASRFGMNNLIVDNEALWFNNPVIDIASSDSVVDAITANGKLIADITGECTVPVEDIDDFVDICSSGQTVYALTTNGDIYMSLDGRSFSLLMSLEIEDEAKNIASVDTSVGVLTTSGHYWNISNGRATMLPLSVDAEKGVMVSNGDSVVISTGTGILMSSNGYYFSNISLQGRLLKSRDFISVSSAPGVIALLNDQGQVFVIPDGDDGYVVDLSDINPTMVSCSSENDIIVLSSDGHAYLLMSDGAAVNLTSGAFSVDSIYTGPNGRVIARTGNNLYIDRVLSGLQIVETVPSETVMSGDICVVSSASHDFFDDWTSYGDGTFLTTSEDDGNRSMVISGIDSGVHAAYQTLEGSSVDNFSENTFYRIELKVKGDIDGNLKVWVSGEDITEGLETEVTEDFDKVSYVFAITDSMLNEDDTVRLNISFEGEGQVYIDDVYLGEDKYEISDIPTSYSDLIKYSNPATMRLPSISIGSNGFSQERFYGMNAGSLENTLRLVRDSNSCPWFVIGSDVKQSDINDFLEYLCGSVSTKYGRLRTDNGTALPWNRQFDRIYIEVDDDIGAYCSDVQRGAYVSYVISLFRQSENYIDVRDKIVFIDGMTYDGGNVLSSADYHAMGLTIDLTGENQGGSNYLQTINGVYTKFIAEAPRVALHMGVGGEYISSLSYELDEGKTLDAAQLVSMFLNDDSQYIKMCLFDMDISDRPVDTESDAIFADKGSISLLQMINNLSFIKNTEGMYCLVGDPLSGTSEDSAEKFNKSCTVEYIAGRENSYLIVANASASQQQFITEGVNMIANDTVITRYSSSGEVLFNRTVKRTDIRFTLQPGEIIVFTIPNV